jgi:hypothetical protein
MHYLTSMHVMIEHFPDMTPYILVDSRETLKESIILLFTAQHLP